MILRSSTAFKSLPPIESLELPDFVVLSGINGSGKSQLLEAIAGQIIKIFIHGRPVESSDGSNKIIKLVTHDTFTPNSAGTISYENILGMNHNLLHNLNVYRSNKKIGNVANFASSFPGLAPIIEKIARTAGKEVDELSDYDITFYYPIEGDLSGDIFTHNLTTLFKRYQVKKYLNEFNVFRQQRGLPVDFLTDEEFERINGLPPWELVNQILLEAKIGYRVTTPEAQIPEAPFQAQLVNELSGAEIDFTDLSSGEKVIMSLALSLYNSQFDLELPRVLLMDEPDAHLHPSMTKQFLEVIQNVFVTGKKIAVFMTTHSPSTVALAPDDSLFIMNKTTPRISKATKDQALRVLTAGVPTLSINYENRRQVFVESRYDVLFYEKIYERLKDKLVPEISISFISSGSGGKGNCDEVKEVVNKLAGYGNRSVYGIIDWDEKNKGNEFVKVLGGGNRYSIENYIFDPVLIAAFLLREKLIDRSSLGLNSKEKYTDFNKLDDAKLQMIADYVVDQVRTKAGNPTDGDILECEYVEGQKIRLPKWFLTIQGHLLESYIKEIWRPLNKYTREGELKIEIIEKVIDDLPELIPKEILLTLSSIQDQ